MYHVCMKMASWSVGPLLFEECIDPATNANATPSSALQCTANSWSFSTLDSTLQKQTSNFLKNFPECSVYNQNWCPSLSALQGSKFEATLHSIMSMSPTRDEYSSLPVSSFLPQLRNAVQIIQISSLSCNCSVLSTRRITQRVVYDSYMRQVHFITIF